MNAPGSPNSDQENTGGLPASVLLDIARPKWWRRLVPPFLRFLIWVDAAAQYDAFLSYSWKADSALAPTIQSVIQQFLRPWYQIRAKTVFRDLSSLPAGSTLEKELFDRLDRSTHLIVLACPEAASSDGMEIEARHWFSRPRNGQVLVIITAGDCDYWPQVRDRLLPKSLRANLGEAPVWISIARRRSAIETLPQPSELRGTLIEDLKQVFLRMYEPRTWEELRGEERKQRKRAIAIVAVTAAIFFSLAIVALRLARVATDERNEAQRQAEIATARQFAAQSELLRSQSATNLPIAVRLAAEAAARYPSAETDSVLWRGLALQPQLVAEVEHGNTVTKVRYAPDGRSVVSASMDGTARIIDANSGRVDAEIHHSGSVWDVAIDPAGRLVATASADGTVQITPWLAPAPRFTLTHVPGKGVRRVVFSPDGSLIATASEDGTARLWTASTGKEVARLVHTRAVWDVAFSPDGRLLASGGRDNLVQIWDSGAKRQIAKLRVPDIVWNVAFSRDGTILAAGTQDGTASVWSLPGFGKLTDLKHGDAVMALGFSPDGQKLVTTSLDRTIRIWSLRDWHELRQIPGQESITTVAFSRDGELFATSGKTARVWSFSTGHEVSDMALDDGCYGVEFSPDGTSLATGSVDHSMRIWRISRGQRAVIRTADHELTRGAPIVTEGWAISIDSTGACLVSGGETGTATVFHLSDGDLMRAVKHSSAVLSVAAAPRCALVATGGSDGGIALWPTGSATASLAWQHQGQVDSLAFNEDGSLLLSASEDGTAGIWDTKLGRQLKLLHHAGPVHAAYFLDAAGTRVLVVSPDDSAVWDTQSGNRIAGLQDLRSISSVAMAANGRSFALGTAGGNVSLWNSQTGTRLASFQASHEVWSISLSPDQKLVATAPLRDRQATVWKAATGEPVFRFSEAANVSAVGFDPSGEFLAVGAVDGSVAVWNLAERRSMVDYRGASNHSVEGLRFSLNGSRLIIGFSDGFTEAITWRSSESVDLACAQLRAPVFARQFRDFVGNAFIGKACQ